MNLQEHIGNYLLLKQVERQGDYELFMASKIDAQHRQDYSIEEQADYVQLIEVLSTPRGEDRHESDALEQLLERYHKESETAASLGWQIIDDISLPERVAAQLQPIYYRPYNEGVSLQSLLEVMRQKNRRFPLPQALHIAHFVIKSAYQLSRIWPTGISRLPVISHVGYQGILTLNDTFLYSTLLEDNERLKQPQSQRPWSESIATLVTALTCDVHLTGPSTTSGESALKRSIDERFQGPPPLKATLKKIVDSLLSFSREEALSRGDLTSGDNQSSLELGLEDDDQHSSFLKGLMTELSEAIEQSSLDCPPALIETFLNSIYPFESAQAKRELIKLKQRAVDALLPSQGRLRLTSVEELFEGDEHTQTTLTVIPRIAPSVQMYDALSTDSESGSDDELAHDIDSDELVINHALIDQGESITKSESSSDQPSLDQPSPDQPSPDQPSPDQPSPDQPSPDQPSPDQPSPDQPSEEESVEPSTDSSSTIQPPKGLLPPRPSDILSLEAQSRRDQGRQLNTLDLLGPVDDFDSIDITGVQAKALKAQHEEKVEASSEPAQKENPTGELKEDLLEAKSPSSGFAGSFKYPEGYDPAASKVSSARRVSSNVSPEHTLRDFDDSEYHQPLPVKSKGSSHFLMAALLAIITAISSNYLAEYVSTPKTSLKSENSTATSLSPNLHDQSAHLKDSAADSNKRSHIDERSPKELDKTSETPPEPPPQAWKQIHPLQSVFRPLYGMQWIDQVHELSAHDLKDTDLVQIMAPGYLPLTIQYSELVKNGEDDRPLRLLQGLSPQLTLKLKISPKSRQVSVRLNGLLQEGFQALPLPLDVMSVIEVTRPQYQPHIFIIKPNLKSLSRQSIFLKSAKRAKPLVTLRSSTGTALLMKRDLRKDPLSLKKLERGLSRLPYSNDSSLEFSVKSKNQISDLWRFSPSAQDIPPAYTIRLETQEKGQGELSFKGGRGLKLKIQPIAQDDSTKDDQANSEVERPINKKLSLEAGSYKISLYDPKLDALYQFTTVIYKKKRSEWKLKRIMSEEQEQDQPQPSWRADFVRFRPLR